jgi:AcrR family transcriptional regulator
LHPSYPHINVSSKTISKTNIGRRRAVNAREGSEFYQDRQQEVMQAAACVFQEKGFQAATIGDIADRLGTDRASVYYYVSSKTELLKRVMREATEKNVDAVEEIVSSEGSAAEKLRKVFVTQLECYRATYPYMHVYLQEKFPALPQDGIAWKREVQQLSDRYFSAFHAILKQGVDNGEMEVNLPLELAAHALIGMVNWAHRWYKPEGKFSAETIGESFASFALKGLLSGRGPAPI